jgi:uncharacterized protein (TIGR03083 family)
MDPATHIAHLRADAALLLEAQQADPHAPAWPGTGWDRTELLAHVAGVHTWVREQLRLGTAERVRLSAIERPPEGDALPGWFEAGAAELVALLEAMDLDATWPTWAGPQPGTFFPRRMAQETSVHRWDATGGELDAEMAVDGIDELLELFTPRVPAERFAEVAPASLHLHATDAEGEWLVHLGPDGVRFEHGHAKGDVALRGAAADLLLWTWNRVPADDRFEVFGDAGPLVAWRTSVVF